jgi:hypothetical protein
VSKAKKLHQSKFTVPYLKQQVTGEAAHELTKEEKDYAEPMETEYSSNALNVLTKGAQIIAVSSGSNSEDDSGDQES